MTLDINKEGLTILGIPFDSFSDFNIVWYVLDYQQLKIMNLLFTM